MSRQSSEVFIDGAASKSQSRRILGATSLAHLFHDGATDMHYLLFAIWQQQFGLSLAQVGLLKMLFSGAMSALQIPAGELGRVAGEKKVLIGGTLLLTAAIFCYGFATTLPVLMGLIVLGGVGASVQHPLSSSYISQSFPRLQARLALSTYNFFGDVGKAIIPSALSALLLITVWGHSVQLIAVAGLLIAGCLSGLLSSEKRLPKTMAPRPSASDDTATQTADAGAPLFTETQRKRAFASLCTIGSLDNATRTGTLTFLPFLLASKGASATQVGFALTVIFIGGALGKLVCGALAPRLGILKTVAFSEIVTAGIILALTQIPLPAIYLLLVPLGIALNGTSSVLYGTVGELAKPRRQTRAFAVFYTASLGCGAVMPLVYGLLGDRLGIAHTLIVIAILLLCILPLLLPLKVITAQHHSPAG